MRFAVLLTVVGLVLGTGAGAPTLPSSADHDLRVRSVYRAGQHGPGGAPVLADETSAAGVLEPLLGMHAHSVATGDVNADGWSDLFVGTFADRPPDDYRVRGATGPSPDRLLLGGRDGFRVDPSFPVEYGRTAAAGLADLDADGDLDLVLGRNVRNSDASPVSSKVLRNDGGHFELASELSEPMGARAIGFVDLDRDGRTDLVIAEDRFAGGSTRVLHNDGDLRFSDVSRAVGLPDGVAGMGVATADLNGDALPDILVSGSNRLFLNQGDGTVREDEAARDMLAMPTFGSEDDAAGVAADDLNGDGRVDLVIGQHYNSTVDDGRSVPVRLFLNHGNDAHGHPRLHDVTKAAGLRPLPTKAPDVDVVDLDADGRLDILTSASTGEGPVVFSQVAVRRGIPRFIEREPARRAEYWVTTATLDADRDGRLDVFVTSWEPDRASRLLRNRTDTGHWFGIAASPGTVVEVFRTGASRSPRPIARREVGTSSGFGAGGATTTWFGLGLVDRIDVRVTNPADGSVIHLQDERADQLVTIAGSAT